MTRRVFVGVLCAACAICAQSDLRLPNNKDGLRFAVIGDTGTGERPQYEVADQLARYHDAFPFEFVLMMGDNLYGGEKPRDFVVKFEKPYAALLQQGIKFYATLGNHDDPNQRSYKGFNMNGQRYYTLKPRNNIEIFCLDSNYMDPPQVDWLKKELSGSKADWKIAFFHHPLYSSGAKHGPEQELRNVLEPMFIDNGVSVVFAGHEHFYERLKPQKGIQYFTEGGSAKLRKGNIRMEEETAKGFDTDNTFMLCEIDGDELHFQTITRRGETIDGGVVARRK